MALDSPINTQTYNKNFKPLLCAICSLGISYSLVGCQTTPTPISHTTNPSTPTAAQLVQNTMLHRFDASYNYQKTITYHATPYLPTNDIEAHDTSLMEALLKNSGNKKSKKSAIETEKTTKTADEVIAQQDTEENATFAAKKAQPQSDLPQTSSKIQTKDSAYIRGVQRAIDKLKQANKDPQDKATYSRKNSSTTETDDSDDSSDSKAANDDVSQMIRQLKLTPQQVQAMDATFFSPKTVSYTGSYHQPSAQFSSVYEQKLQTPFMEKYQRVPVLVDLNRMSLTLEPDAAFIFMALFASNIEADNSEKIAQLAGKSVRFTLPAKLTQKIPLPVLKDSLLTAIGQAYGDIDSEKFSEIVMDDYGRNLHASRVVKLNLTPKELGNLVGRSLKHWAVNLNQISQAHPEYIQNYPEFSKTLELMTLVNQHYRAEDLARFAQFVETILPIGYSGYNYYYFNANNQLIGYRKTTDYSSSLLNTHLVTTTQSQIQYTNNATPVHPYYQPATSDIIDGNALLADMTQTTKLKKAAREARWTYPDTDGDSVKDKQRHKSKSYRSKYAKKSPYRQRNYHKKYPTLSDD